MLIALTTCMETEEEGECCNGGCESKTGQSLSHIYIYIYIKNLFRVSLFHSDEISMCMHAQEVIFFSK